MRNSYISPLDLILCILVFIALVISFISISKFNNFEHSKDTEKKADIALDRENRKLNSELQKLQLEAHNNNKILQAMPDKLVESVVNRSSSLRNVTESCLSFCSNNVIGLSLNDDEISKLSRYILISIPAIMLCLLVKSFAGGFIRPIEMNVQRYGIAVGSFIFITRNVFKPITVPFWNTYYCMNNLGFKLPNKKWNNKLERISPTCILSLINNDNYNYDYGDDDDNKEKYNIKQLCIRLCCLFSYKYHACKAWKKHIEDNNGIRLKLLSWINFVIRFYCYLPYSCKDIMEYNIVDNYITLFVTGLTGRISTTDDKHIVDALCSNDNMQNNIFNDQEILVIKTFLNDIKNEGLLHSRFNNLRNSLNTMSIDNDSNDMYDEDHAIYHVNKVNDMYNYINKCYTSNIITKLISGLVAFFVTLILVNIYITVIFAVAIDVYHFVMINNIGSMCKSTISYIPKLFYIPKLY